MADPPVRPKTCIPALFIAEIWDETIAEVTLRIIQRGYIARTNIILILPEIQWKCEADLDQRVKFGRMTVSCEGYNGVDDEWVVDGSCSLQYELDRTYTDEWEYADENGKFQLLI